jgi:uncharacterized protein (TIGR00266 family)
MDSLDPTHAAPLSFEILHAGDSPCVKVGLPEGRSIYADGGSMLASTANIKVEGSMKGGLLGGLARKLLRGETFFFQTLQAQAGPGEVLLAPPPPGEVKVLEIDGSVEWLVQKGGFLAASQTIHLETKTQNLVQGLFSGEGFFISRIKGHGTLVLNSFGAMHEVSLGAGEEYVVDNGHLIAWTASTQYKITKASKGWISTVTSGEGFVCRFTGPGTVYMQTRNPRSFGNWLSGYLPVRNG